MRARSTEDGRHAGQSAVCAGTHVQWLGGRPQGVDADHLSRSRIQAAQCSAAQTGQVSELLVAPRRNSMRMSGVGAQLGAGEATGTKVGTRTLRATSPFCDVTPKVVGQHQRTNCDSGRANEVAQSLAGP